MRTRIISLLLLGCLSLGLCACQDTAPAAALDMDVLQTALLDAAPSLPEMYTRTGGMKDAATDFAKFCALDYDKVADYLLLYSAEGKADEIVVIAVNDPAEVSLAEDSLREHWENRLKLYRQYSPAEVKRAEAGALFTQDQYAVLIICDEVQAVKDAFTAALESTKEG